MKKHVVSSDFLAQFLILDIELEPYPEPFRGQPQMRFEIPFTEYLEFIDFYLGDVDFLSTKTHLLKYHLHRYRMERDADSLKFLFRCFQKDVSFAVAKELFYSQRFGMNPSEIVHSTANPILTSETVISNVLPRALSYESKLQYELQVKDYYVDPTRLTTKGREQWNYALVLYYLSNLDFTFWSYSE